MATKIYKIQVRIHGSATGRVIHDLSWGMCFCGSYLNGSVVADTINELLSSLKVAEGTPIDGNAIIDIAFDIFKEISNHLIELHRESGFSRIMIGGICPVTGHVNLYHFNWKLGDGGRIEYILTRESFESPFIAIGDSKAVEKAIELSRKINYQQLPGYTEYHLLQNIIDDKTIGGVGGPIQTGHFVNGIFRLFGMADWEIRPVGNEDKPVWVFAKYSFMGIPIHQAINGDERVKIDTDKVFMDPFTDKRQELGEKD